MGICFWAFISSQAAGFVIAHNIYPSKSLLSSAKYYLHNICLPWIEILATVSHRINPKVLFKLQLTTIYTSEFTNLSTQHGWFTDPVEEKLETHFENIFLTYSQHFELVPWTVNLYTRLHYSIYRSCLAWHY